MSNSFSFSFEKNQASIKEQLVYAIRVKYSWLSYNYVVGYVYASQQTFASFTDPTRRVFKTII